MSQTYTFDTSVLEATFKGKEFYEMHKDDIFLTDPDTLENILCQGKKIRAQLKTLQPGQTLKIGDAMVSLSVPLLIKKGGGDAKNIYNEYTLNRLTGMCAAFAATQSSTFVPKCAMAISLGLDVGRDRVLYYSAAPGAEHFTEVFTYLPLLCALKQLENGKVTRENIARIATVKNSSGQTLSAMLTSQKTSLPQKLARFGTGGTRGLVELDKALQVLRSVGASTSR